MNNNLYITIVFVALLLSGCIKDDEMQQCEGQIKIQLSLDDTEAVEITKVTTPGTTNERTFDDLYLLVFDGTTKKLKAGEKVDITTKLSGNGKKLQTITSYLPIADGDNVVVLGNTDQASMPTGMVVGTSTTDDINTCFPANSAVSPAAGWMYKIDAHDLNYSRRNEEGMHLPMSGEMTWGGTEKVCEVYRSVAKIQVSFQFEKESDDATGLFWGMQNDGSGGSYPKLNQVQVGVVNSPKFGNIYSHEFDMSIPASYGNWFSIHFMGALELTTPISSISPYFRSYYVPEYPNATRAQDRATSKTIFDPGRMCVLIAPQSSRANMYRLDFYDREKGEYIDVKRNHHYTFVIKKIESYGYNDSGWTQTVPFGGGNLDPWYEVLMNPSSNIEYEIHITGDDDNYTDSNGQYALSTDKTAVKLFNDDDHVFKFSLTAPTYVNLITAYVDIVDADKYYMKPMPDCFRINNTLVPDPIKNRIDLGTQHYSAEFTLDCEALSSNVAEIKALVGCYFRVRMGNITKYVLIDGIGKTADPAFYYGTANCIEMPAGTQQTKTFDVTPYSSEDSSYGQQNYLDKDMCKPRSAAMLWSDVSANHLTNISLNWARNKYNVTFTSSGEAGNAVIAIYNTEDPTDPNAVILWSYHIWVSDRNVIHDQKWSVINSTDRTIVKEKYTMMDRNLGATSNVVPATENGFDNSAYGLFYQWGRKDPFVGGQVYYGSGTLKQRYTPTGETWTDIKYETSSAEVGTIAYSVEHPTTYIAEKGNPYNTGNDWLWARNNALWGNPTTSTTLDYYPRSVGRKSIYDPCPEGYCVPPQDAFTMTITAAGFGIGSNGMFAPVSGWNAAVSAYGCNFYYEDTKPVGNTVYLPFAGCLNRTQALLGGAGTDGYYWTNTNLTSGNANAATRASFSSSTWNPLWGGGRAMGQSVRCMRIPEDQ